MFFLLLLLQLFSFNGVLRAAFEIEEEEIPYDPDVIVEEMEVPGIPPAPLPKLDADNKPIGIPIKIPIIGTVYFEPVESNPDNPDGPTTPGFRIQYPRDKSLSVGNFLTLDGGAFFTEGEGKTIAYNGTATFLGNKARVGIKEAVSDSKGFSKIRFGLTFIDKKPVVSFYAGKEIVLNAVDLIFEDGKPPIIFASTVLFGAKANVGIGGNSREFVLKVEIPRLDLENLVSDGKNTALAGSYFTELVYNIRVPYSGGAIESKNLEGSCSGKMYFANKLLDMDPDSPDRMVEFSAKAKGRDVSIEGTMHRVNVGLLGTLETAKLKIDIEENKDPRISLVGIQEIKINALGSMVFEIDVSFDRNDYKSSGILAKPARLAGDIDISKATLSYQSRVGKKIGEEASKQDTGALEISATAKIKDMDVTLAITRSGEPVYAISGKVAARVHPFKNADNPQLRNIAFEEATLMVQGQSTEDLRLKLTGKVYILGKLFNGTLEFKKKGPEYIALVMVDIGDSKISEAIESLRGTFFDELPIKRMRLLATNSEFEDVELELIFRPGITLMGEISLSGPLEPYGKLIGIDPSREMRLFTLLKLNPAESMFGIKLPTELSTPSSGVWMKDLELQLAGKPDPSIAVIGTMSIKPSAQDEPLSLMAKLELHRGAFVISATMKGDWKEPFGAKNVAISDVAYQLGVNPVTFLVQGPDRLGFTGKVALGSNEIMLAGQVASMLSIDELVLSGALKSMTLSDLLSIVSALIRQNIPTGTLPTIGFQDIKLFFVPKSTEIGEIAFDRGMGFGVKGVLLGSEIRANLSYTGLGITGEGALSEIKKGPFAITGDAPDGKGGKGMILKFDLTPFKQRIYGSGLIKLDPVFAVKSDLDIGVSGLTFSASAKLFSLDAKISGEVKLDDPDIGLALEFSDALANAVKQDILNEISKAQAASKKALADAQREVMKEQARVNTNIRNANREILGAADKVRAAQGKLDPVKTKCDEMKKTCDKSKKGAKEFFENAWACGGVAAVCGTYYASIGVLQGTEGFLREVTTRVQSEVQKFGADVVLESAKQFLSKVAQDATYYVLEGAKISYDQAISQFGIKKITASVKASELVSGNLPKLRVDLTVGGKDHTFEIPDFNISRPVSEAALQCAKEIMKVLGARPALPSLSIY